MITVLLNEANFEYDIHSLIKAFYPREEVSVSAELKEEEGPITLQMVISYLRDGKCCCAAAAQGKGHPQEEDPTGGPVPGNIHFTFLQPQKADWIREEETDAPLPLSFRMALQGDVDVDFADRAQTKNRLKRKLYELLVEYTGQSLPWGTLTGIRPTKIPMKMLEEGSGYEQIRQYMKETYFTSDAKIDLAVAVAKKELDLLEQIDYQDGYSLYLGIPFCPTTCAYCSFTSFPLSKWAGKVDAYLDALEKEIDFTAEQFRGRKLNSIYMGGGTPTTLEACQFDRILSALETKLDLSHVSEFTVEAGRPDSISREKLAMLRQHGISRISINPQTMKQETLDLIGRRHTVEQTRQAFALAREMGFTNINMDLIVGLPQEDLEDVRQTMIEVEKLSPDSLTVHSLAIKRAARLRMKQEDYQDMQMVNTWDTINLTAEYAQKMGLEPYYLYRQKNMAGNFENVGYSRKGCEGLYNILIMEEKQDIVALGAGTVSKRVWPTGGRIERCDNVKDVTLYMDRIDEMIERKRKLYTME